MKKIKQLILIPVGIILFLFFNLIPAWFIGIQARSNVTFSPVVNPKQSETIENNRLVSSNVCPEFDDNVIAGMSTFQLLDNGDRCHQSNNFETATQWYQEGKEPYPDIDEDEKIILDPIYEEEDIDIGKNLWKKYQEIKDKPRLESGKFSRLYQLVKKAPNFIPGYFALRDLYKEFPDWCDLEERPGNTTFCQNNPQNAVEVLAKGVALYPSNPDLVIAYIDELVEAEDYLDASIEARQFHLFGDRKHPQWATMDGKATEYLEKYKAELNSELVTASIVACAAIFAGGNPQTCAGIRYFLEGENVVGKNAAEIYKQRGNIIENEKVNEYVRGIADSVIPFFGRDDLEYEINVIEDSSLNAFALPGGKIFINTGAILNTKSTAELAGIMGHEIAHAVYSHGFRKVANSMIVGTVVNLLGPFQGVGSYIGGFINLSMSREAETQADILGLRVLDRSGYSADGLPDFMATIGGIKNPESLRQDSRSTSSNLTEWASSHPLPENRVRYLQELIIDNGYNRYGYEGVRKHREIQNILKGSTS